MTTRSASRRQEMSDLRAHETNQEAECCKNINRASSTSRRTLESETESEKHKTAY